MINYISINNFRCFEQTQIGGFGHVNLIGGLNNSGKTALLEAILLSEYPTTNALSVIRNLRNEDFEIDSVLNPWRFLFFNQEDKKLIEIFTKNKSSISKLFISCTSNIEELLAKNSSINEERFSRLFGTYSNPFFLNFSGGIKGEHFEYIPFLRGQQKGNRFFPANYIGKIPDNYDLVIKNLFHSLIKKEDNLLSKLYSLLDENGKIDELNHFLNLLDSRIVSSKISAPEGKPVIVLKLNNGQSFPVKLFGDAIQKAIEILLVILNTSDEIILIDEIENGLHYTKHRDFWKALFTIAKNQNVQIFATTHSKEMIGAFAEVAQKAQKETQVEGVYFQMFRSEDDNQIVAAPYSAEELDFALTGNLPLRGENV